MYIFLCECKFTFFWVKCPRLQLLTYTSSFRRNCHTVFRTFTCLLFPRNWPISFQGVELMSTELFVVFSYYPFSFSRICSDLPVPFLLLICVFSLFISFSLARDVSILPIYFKNQLFLSLTFSIVFHFSILLISAFLYYFLPSAQLS